MKANYRSDPNTTLKSKDDVNYALGAVLLWETVARGDGWSRKTVHRAIYHSLYAGDSWRSTGEIGATITGQSEQISHSELWLWTPEAVFKPR